MEEKVARLNQVVGPRLRALRAPVAVAGSGVGWDGGSLSRDFNRIVAWVRFLRVLKVALLFLLSLDPLLMYWELIKSTRKANSIFKV